MKGKPFPLWQVDRNEYGLVCAHLGLQPDERLYARLDQHLAGAALTAPRPGPFARRLARAPLSRWRIARLDLASRLFMPSHPIRHTLNGVIALHECSGDGYQQLSRTRDGAGVWLVIAGEALRLCVALALTLPWLAAQGPGYLLSRLHGREVDLEGRRVLVTGVARGLGHDLMLECLERGAQVVGMVRSAASAKAVRDSLPAMAPVSLVAADLSSPGTATSALDATGLAPGSIDLALLCAGAKHDGHSVLDLERLRDTLQVNLLSAAELAAWLCRTGAPGPRALGVVSSIGRWHGMHSSAGYNASKAALSIWAESLELDLSRRGGARPTVTVIEPGLFDSDMTATGGLRRLLSVPRRQLASRIVDAVAAGRRSLRVPGWFVALTWAVCLAGRGLRLRLFARAKPGATP